jgi:hypothetical protein
MIPLSSGEEKNEFYSKDTEDPHDPHRLFSNTIQSSCPDVTFQSNTTVNCDDILIFSTDKCAQKLGKSYSKVFMFNQKKFLKQGVSNSFFVNIETKGSESGYIKTSGRSAYAKLARKFCPKIVEVAGKFY